MDVNEKLGVLSASPSYFPLGPLAYVWSSLLVIEPLASPSSVVHEISLFMGSMLDVKLHMYMYLHNMYAYQCVVVEWENIANSLKLVKCHRIVKVDYIQHIMYS